MADISTLEQLSEFVRTRTPHGIITGDLAVKFAQKTSYGGNTLPITRECVHGRDPISGVTKVNENWWVHFGNTRIELGNILYTHGIELPA